MSCTLQDAGEFVQARIGPAPLRTILDCCRELLSLCAAHHIERALLISEDADATTHAALEGALRAMSEGRPAPGFKLAIVALPRTFDLYRAAEQLAARNGFTARAFDTRGEAVQWLTGRPPGERDFPRY